MHARSEWRVAELWSFAPLDSRRRLFPRETMNSMSQEILSIAIFEPLQGHEEASLNTMRALIAALSTGGYSRDVLYRDAKSRDQYILLRHWKSEDARRAALEDSEVLPCWAKLSHEIRTLKIYETLEDALAGQPG